MIDQNKWLEWTKEKLPDGFAARLVPHPQSSSAWYIMIDATEPLEDGLWETVSIMVVSDDAEYAAKMGMSERALFSERFDKAMSDYAAGHAG